MTTAPEPQELAAVDLGSNSFRLQVARVIDGEIRVVDQVREGVRLAAYIDDQRRITGEGRERALEALRRFGDRVRELPRCTVRAVGTNTLRRARNGDQLLEEGERALGHPIEVIRGQEEARLIYLGASRAVSVEGAKLVLDIGGGSTECALGVGGEPELTESLYIGCVAFSERFFPNGKLTRKRFREAETAAALELRGARRKLRKRGWDRCLGCSGTFKAVATICATSGWGNGGIDLPGARRLRRELIRQGAVEGLALPGLSADRAAVLPGGLAIVLALLGSLGIDRIGLSTGALREGVLVDLLGRIRHDDVRDRTIAGLAERGRLDLEQAERVKETAVALLESVREPWALEAEWSRKHLEWAALLHELGLGVAHAGYHKHGEYLVEHGDLPGLSSTEQRVVARLVRLHRRRFDSALVEDLPESLRAGTLRLAVILRLAFLLHRSRSEEPLPSPLASH